MTPAERIAQLEGQIGIDRIDAHRRIEQLEADLKNEQDDHTLTVQTYRTQEGIWKAREEQLEGLLRKGERVLVERHSWYDDGDYGGLVDDRLKWPLEWALIDQIRAALAGEQDQPKGGDANGAIDADTGTLETADAVKGAAHPDNADAICEADRILSSLKAELFADMVEVGIAGDKACRVLDRAFYHASPGTRLDALLIRLHDPTARVLR